MLRTRSFVFGKEQNSETTETNEVPDLNCFLVTNKEITRTSSAERAGGRLAGRVLSNYIT